MEKALAEALVIRRKMFVVQFASGARNKSKECREFGVPRSSFYRWKRAFEKEGIEGLIRKKPIARRHPRQLAPEFVEKILHLRRVYHLGPQRITWYLQRYHGVETSCSSVYRTLVRNGLRRLPRKVGRRVRHTHRYAKRVPGHQIQVDVKFITLKAADGSKVRRFQYTAVDDATRIRALKIYRRHNQKNAIDIIDYVIEKFPFRIHTVRTDRDMSFNHTSTGTLKTKGSDMCISNHARHSSMGRSRNPTVQTRRSSTSYSRIPMMWISTGNWPSGRTSTPTTARMEHLMERHLTRH